MEIAEKTDQTGFALLIVETGLLNETLITDWHHMIIQCNEFNIP